MLEFMVLLDIARHTLPYLSCLPPASSRRSHSPTNPWSDHFLTAWFGVLLASPGSDADRRTAL
ncbi:MAG: hypothetical protein NTV52_36965 [Acidobacteria bacterium]|nr:hypothetical protein [Acidobacteriota bacterium]